MCPSGCWDHHPGGTEVTPVPLSPELLRAPELPPHAPQGLQGGPEAVPHQEPDLGRGEEQEGDVQSAQEALRLQGPSRTAQPGGCSGRTTCSCAPTPLSRLLPWDHLDLGPASRAQPESCLRILLVTLFCENVVASCCCVTPPDGPGRVGDSLVGLGLVVSALPGNLVPVNFLNV